MEKRAAQLNNNSSILETSCVFNQMWFSSSSFKEVQAHHTLPFVPYGAAHDGFAFPSSFQTLPIKAISSTPTFFVKSSPDAPAPFFVLSF